MPLSKCRETSKRCPGGTPPDLKEQACTRQEKRSQTCSTRGLVAGRVPLKISPIPWGMTGELVTDVRRESKKGSPNALRDLGVRPTESRISTKLVTVKKKEKYQEKSLNQKNPNKESLRTDLQGGTKREWARIAGGLAGRSQKQRNSLSEKKELSRGCRNRFRQDGE